MARMVSFIRNDNRPASLSSEQQPQMMRRVSSGQKNQTEHNPLKNDDARKVTPTGCPVRDIREKLSAFGMRPTRQRVALGWLLFGRGHRHICADDLYKEAQRARIFVSLATVYNTLNQFSNAGLVRSIITDQNRVYYDTNQKDHHHFFDQSDGRLFDIPADHITISNLPEVPEGMEVERVDVIIRLKKSKTKS